MQQWRHGIDDSGRHRRRRGDARQGRPPGRFSLELNEDQRDIRDWVHEFAEGVVRPAAARVGRARGDAVADHRGGGQDRPLRLRGPGAVLGRPDRADAARSSTRSCSGATPASAGDHGHDARRRRASSRHGTPEQIGEWVPQCFGTPDDLKVAAFCVSEPDAGSDVSSLRTRAGYDEATDEWVLNGTKTWITNGGIADVHVVVASVDPELGARGQAAFVVPPGTPGPRRWGRSSRSTASAPRTPPRSSSTTAASPAAACSAARRSSTSGSPAPARARASRRQAAMAARSRSAARPSARRRSASPAPRTSTRSTTPRSASSSAARSSRTRRSRSSSPT